MKKLVKHIFFIFLIICIGAFCLDNIYDQIFMKTSPRDKVQLAIKQNQDHVNYLFLGNSRVENFIDCELIEEMTGKSCSNYAFSGGSYEDAFVLLKLLKKRHLTYDHIFLQLDASIKGGKMTQSFKASLVPFVKYYDINLENVDLNLTWEEKYIPFYRYAEYDYLYGFRSCVAQLYKNQDEDIELGYKPKFETGKAYSSTINNLPLKNKFVEFIKQEVKKDKAQIHFFTSPYCAEMENTEAFNQYNFIYSDYVNYSSFYSDPAYFANCTHMNHTGAQIFTVQIINDFNL